MFIEQTKQMDGYTAAPSLEKGKMTAADKVLEGTSILDFGKMQETYRMTEGGSFYMPNAIYQKPEAKEEESIVNQLDVQMDMSASNRKNQMVVVSNTASSADLEEMAKDGFNCMDADSHTIVTVTDKIKTVLAKAGVDISIYGDDLSKAELEELTGSPAVAAQIEAALNEAKATAKATTADKIHCNILSSADFIHKLFQRKTAGIPLRFPCIFCLFAVLAFR